jgi:hypothetical protein
MINRLRELKKLKNKIDIISGKKIVKKVKETLVNCICCQKSKPLKEFFELPRPQDINIKTGICRDCVEKSLMDANPTFVPNTNPFTPVPDTINVPYYPNDNNFSTGIPINWV